MPNFWEMLPFGPGVKVLTVDRNGLAGLDKPAGIRSHPNEPGADSRSLLTCDYDQTAEFYRWVDAEGGERRLWLLNRLDAATSGVILVSSSESLAKTVKEQFARKTIRKIYQALVFGQPGASVQMWRDLLSVEKRDGQIRTKAAGNIPAESGFRMLKQKPGSPALTLAQLEPRTGRSHQLRVQCAKRHLPIVGDATYGDFRANRDFAKRTGFKRLFLHSAETRFGYHFNGKDFSFAAKAELPHEFLDGMK